MNSEWRRRTSPRPMRPGPELAQGNLGFSGLLSVVGGVLLGITPLIGALVLTWWLGAYALVFGGTLLALAFRLHSQRASAAHSATPHPA